VRTRGELRRDATRISCKPVSFLDRSDVPRPWEGPSLYDYVRSRIDPETGRLPRSAEVLPDEEEDSGKIRWAAGAIDGVMGHHAGSSDEKLRVKQLVKAIGDLLGAPTAANLAHLHRLSKDSLLGIIDQVMDGLRDDERITPDRLHELGRLLALEAPDRETVKLGIALVGMIAGPDDSDLLGTLGVHDEFTLFCAVALQRQSAEPDTRLWELAKKVDGWGRIQIVERLAQTENPEIRAWMLREGFRNSVMDEYLACICARAGRLHEALSAVEIDDELLIGASGLLRALATGGPAEELSDYEHATAAVASYLAHLERRTLELAHIEALDALVQRSELPEELRERIDALRGSEAAGSAIRRGLRSLDPVTFGHADQAAHARGISSFEQHASRLKENRGDTGYHLFRLMQDADDARIDHALEVARLRIPLAEVATGAADEMGLGPGTERYHLLDSVLQELARFPGRGTPFLLAGLRSPVIRNRNLAARALATWGTERWSDEVRDALTEAAASEPVAKVKETLERVLAGGQA
jgi:hypothetical protein